MHISVDDYHTNLTKRQTADAVLARFELTNRWCTGIDIESTGVTFEFMSLRNGKPYVVPGRDEVLTWTMRRVLS